MNHFAQWYQNLMTSPSLSLRAEVQATGLRNKHLGPRVEFAEIEVTAQPSTQFEVEFGANLDPGTPAEYLQGSVFGLMDVLLVSGQYPLRNVRLTISRIGIDTISSSEMAFRHAGREAAKVIIAAACGMMAK